MKLLQQMVRRYIFLIGILTLVSCKNETKNMDYEYTNDLINESSPYLLQHAHNPVNWKPWNEEVLVQAAKENKPVLISIGYASCHWCHVMEKECFEDPEVARIMNENFISIKIDREERPDVDQIYMDALQLMTGQGGWPLNVITLPNGKPFWGATYLPKDKWLSSLSQLSELYKNEPDKIREYADNLAKGVNAMQLIDAVGEDESLSAEETEELVNEWGQYFDTFLGGYKRAPKFMMPNNLDFLLHYGFLQQNDSILDYVNTTLTRMAYGGLFDPIDGGFSRYSVDTKWHVPHFEKMLYDNGQLISLYSKAYALTKNPLYRETVEKTIAFVENHLRAEEGGYYSSLDADSLNDQSELEEGAFYVWTEQELRSVLKEDFGLFSKYYNINSYGLWEEEKYVLIRDKSDDEIAKEHGLSPTQLKSKIEGSLEILKEVRDKRPQPRLDDKVLTSWNALYLQGLVDAGRYLQNDHHLEKATALANFLKHKMKGEEGGLYRNYKDNKASITAFLDDYSTLIEAYISLFEISGEISWLREADRLVEYCNSHFSTEDNDLYYYTSNKSSGLIRRSIEVSDNVISASNSVMMLNLQRLGKLLGKKSYQKRASSMLLKIQSGLQSHPQGYANWMHGLLHQQRNYYEIAIVGSKASRLSKELASSYLPNSVIIWHESPTDLDLDLLKSRWVPDQTLVYVCIEGSCKLPVTDTNTALKQLGKPYSP